MVLTEKKKKAIAAAVAYLIEEEEAAEALHCLKARNMWVNMGKESIMQNRVRIQRRGRSLPMH